jgi:hypothetical protein
MGSLYNFLERKRGGAHVIRDRNSCGLPIFLVNFYIHSWELAAKFCIRRLRTKVYNYLLELYVRSKYFV